MTLMRTWYPTDDTNEDMVSDVYPLSQFSTRRLSVALIICLITSKVHVTLRG
ncbi:hypothetical protein DPMN_032787 [Dreissena polymorpha]|uniref:Uncharacterized protein n=1 Tax=Dreissena polymorpha TaxID=45954 RepID=A0A9D4M3L9_DREPO|nr:hypothetical protein DPMN_032787 [Dreissena polymorpha]